MLGKSRQAFYKQFQSSLQKLNVESIVLQDVKKVRAEQPRVGTIKLYEQLKPKWKAQHLAVGRDRLYQILNDHQMLIRRRKRLRPRTTFSQHPFHTYSDLVKELAIIRPHQVYVSDITYLRMATNEFCYLFLTTDAYSKMIVGYKLAKSLKMVHAIAALEMADKQRDKTITTIHHSDRGIQYCSPRFTKKLKKKNYQISMTQDSDPRDNAVAERLNGILKEELIYPFGFPENVKQAAQQVQRAVQTYNYERLHLSCDLKVPALIHHGTHKAKRKWKS